MANRAVGKLLDGHTVTQATPPRRHQRTGHNAFAPSAVYHPRRLARCEPFPLGTTVRPTSWPPTSCFHVDLQPRPSRPEGFPGSGKRVRIPADRPRQGRTPRFLPGKVSAFGAVARQGSPRTERSSNRQTAQHARDPFRPRPRFPGCSSPTRTARSTADAYQITGHGPGPRKVWSQSAVPQARQPPANPRRTVIDWPDGWAHLLPDASLRFRPCADFRGRAAAEYTPPTARFRLPDPWGPGLRRSGRTLRVRARPQEGFWAHSGASQLPA